MSAQAAQILAWILFILAILLFGWAVFFDFARRQLGKAPRRRCPKCWYDMTHSPGMTCSECGYVARRERTLHKSRKRKRWAAVAAALAVGAYGFHAYPRVRDHGWAGAVPTSALIATLPYLHPDHIDLRPDFGLPSAPETRWRTWSGDLFREMSRRASDDLLYDWQWRWLIRRARRGDAHRPPTYSTWKKTYGELLERAIAADQLDYPEALEFARGHVRIELLRPRAWPTGETVSVTALVDGWNPTGNAVGIGYRIGYDEDINDGLTIEGLSFREGLFIKTGFTDDIGLSLVRWDVIDPCLPTPRLTVQVNWSDRYDGQMTFAGPVRETFYLPLEPMPRLEIDEIIRPVVDDELTRAIEDSLRVEVVPRSDGKVHMEIDARPLHDVFASRWRPAISADLELLRNGEVVDRHAISLWAPPSNDLVEIERQRWPIYLIEYYFPKFDDLRRTPSGRVAFSEGDYALRLRSNPKHALEIYCCDTYWDGEVTIPLEIPEELREELNNQGE